MITVNRKQITIPFEERIICRYGDNGKDVVKFCIDESEPGDCRYYLYILFHDERVNCVMLEQNDSLCEWRVAAEDIFVSGIAYIQVKSVSAGGEIWHSPKATVEFMDSLDGRDTDNFTPSLYQQLDSKVNEIYELADTMGTVVREYINEIISTLDDGEYITRPEAVSLINTAIDDLLLPLDNRLDGRTVSADGTRSDIIDILTLNSRQT